jgi:hypothetical protein
MHAAAGVYSVTPLTLKISKTDRRGFTDGKVSGALTVRGCSARTTLNNELFAASSCEKMISLLRCLE